MSKLSIILPAKNEAEGLKSFLPRLRKQQPHAEIIVVNDGSTDSTAEVCLANGAIVVTHPYSMGNGAAIKSGARHATGDILIFMDDRIVLFFIDPIYQENIRDGCDRSI